MKAAWGNYKPNGSSVKTAFSIFILLNYYSVKEVAISQISPLI